MNDNDKGSDGKGRSKLLNRLKDPFTAATYGVCALFIVFFAVSGLMRNKKEDTAVNDASSETVQITSETSVTFTTTSAAATSSVSKTTSTRKSAEAFVSVSGSSSSAAATTAKTKKSTSSVKTLVLTSAPVTSVTTVTPSATATVTASAETAPPTTTVSSDTETETTPVSSSEKVTTSKQSFPADINTITYEGLLQIPGVGEKTAQEILDLREKEGKIYNMELLLEIYGIGEKRLSELSEYLYVSSSDYMDMPTSTVTTVTVTVPVTKPPESSQTSAVTEPPARKSVHINSASASEIASSLLLPMEKAEAIVSVRERIGGFSAIEELLLVDALTSSDISSIKDYIIID